MTFPIAPGTGRIRRNVSGNSGGVVASLRIRLERTAIFALAWAALGAQAQVPGALTDAHVRQSLAQGYWLVRPGDRLRAIARRFFPHDRERTNALRNALLTDNPGAFVKGDANALLMGAKLLLPADLTGGSIEGPSATSSRRDKRAASPVEEKPRQAVQALGVAPPSAPPAAVERGAEPPPIAEKLAPAPPRAPSYVDRLIDETMASESALDKAAEEEPEPFGRRALAINVRSEWRDNGARRLWEHGLGIAYRRETALWGEWGIDADVREAQTTDRLAQTHALGGKITLTQYHFPVTGNWLADSSAGVLRSLPPTLVATGFRVNLPAPLLWGAASTLYNENTRLYANAGRGARLTGFSTQAVEFDETRAGLLGLEHQLFPSLRLGTQANLFRLSDAQPWQSSVVIAAEAYSAVTHDRLKIAALTDDTRRKAFWFEGQASQGFFLHRFGGYQFGRDVAYNAVPTVGDERLLYVRTDYRTQRMSYSLALDASQTNLARDAARSGADALAAFASVNLRLTRTLTSGGSMSVRHEEPRTVLGLRKNTDSETAFLRISSILGTASFDLSRSFA
ncbi:MAG TPA: hypothetical protein VN878_06290, partial [Usitatibacter sp.]|nr:hypothetical protein [Usitatibacter sp.]